MKVDWSNIPSWLNTVTQVVREQDGKFLSDSPMAWDGDSGLQPTIWVNPLDPTQKCWDDKSEHMLFAYLPGYLVEYEEGDTTENSIQFRPTCTAPVTEPPEQSASVLSVHDILTDEKGRPMTFWGGKVPQTAQPTEPGLGGGRTPTSIPNPTECAEIKELTAQLDQLRATALAARRTAKLVADGNGHELIAVEPQLWRALQVACRPSVSPALFRPPLVLKTYAPSARTQTLGACRISLCVDPASATAGGPH